MRTVIVNFEQSPTCFKASQHPRDRQQLMVLPGGGCIRAFPSSFEGPLVEVSVTERAKSHAFKNIKTTHQATEVVLFLNCTYASRPLKIDHISGD